MSSAPTARAAPEWHVFELPRRRPVPFIGILACALIGPGLGAIFRIAGTSLTWSTAVGASIAGVLVGLCLRSNRLFRIERDAFVHRIAGLTSSPVADAMRRAWTRGGAPSRQVIVDELMREAATATAVRVILFQPAVVPNQGDYRFEPEVVGSTAGMARLLVAGIGVILESFAAWHVVEALPFGTIFRLIPCAAFAFLIIGGATIILRGGPMWLWRTTMGSKYLRVAPGMIQVIQYNWRGRLKAIRSYSIDSGTLVVLIGGSVFHRILLARGGLRDEWVVPIGPARSRLRQRIWLALTSTAPTPPLSEEELVG